MEETKFEELKEEKKEKKSLGKKMLNIAKKTLGVSILLGIGGAIGYFGRRYIDKETYEAAERQWAHERKMAERNNN